MLMILTLLQKRPLAVSLSLYLLIGFFAVYCELFFLIPFLLFLLPLLFFGLSFSKNRYLHSLSLCRGAFVLLSLFLAFSAVVFGNVSRQSALAREFDPNEEVYASFEVKKIHEKDGVTTVMGKLTPSGSKERFGTLLYFFGDTLILMEDDRYLPLCEGDTITGYFSLDALDVQNPDDLKSFSSGATLMGSYLRDAELISHKRTLRSPRDAIAKIVTEKLGTYGRGMIKALLIADKGELSQTVKENFETLGISHLFAVSGLHLTILIGMLAHVLSSLSVRRRASHPILAAVVLLYAVITDFTPSLLRAGGMLLLFYLSDGVKRKKDSVTSLLTATAVIVTLSPRAIVDPGLLFSFLATLGILTLALPLLSSLNRHPFFLTTERAPLSLIKRMIRTSLTAAITTVSATAFILPISTLLDGKVFLLAPLSNLIYAPIITLLLYLMPLFLLTAYIPLIGSLVALVIEWLSMAVASLSYLAKVFEAFSLSLGYDFFPILIALLIAAALPFLLYQKRAIAFLILSSFFLLAPLGVMVDDLTLKHTESVSYYADGKNDLLCVEYEKHRLAILASSSSSFVKKTLDRTPLTSPSVEFDTLFFTNLSSTHALLIYELWESGAVRHVVIPDNHTHSAYLKGFAKSLGISVTSYTPNDTILYNGIAVTTHADVKGAVKAVSVKTENKRLLYLFENAPNDFDIRFGVMREHFDTVILGCHGSEMSGSVLLDSSEVWEYERSGYIVPQRNQLYRNSDFVFYDKREKQQ